MKNTYQTNNRLIGKLQTVIKSHDGCQSPITCSLVIRVRGWRRAWPVLLYAQHYCCYAYNLYYSCCCNIMSFRFLYVFFFMCFKYVYVLIILFWRTWLAPRSEPSQHRADIGLRAYIFMTTTYYSDSIKI